MSSITVQTCSGTRVYHTPEELHAEIWRLYGCVNKSNEAAARAYFALGELLVKSFEQIKLVDGQMTLKHLIAQTGLHHQKGKRAIKWYRALRDDEDGSFSMHKYRNGVHEVVESINNGTMSADIDDDGNPSVYAVSKRMGLHGPAAQRECLGVGKDSAVPREPYVDPYANEPNPVLAAINALPRPVDDDADDESPQMLDAPTALREDHTPDDARAAGASGPQMMINFDLIARERELRTSVQTAAALLKSGSLDQATAAGIDSRLRKAIDYINQNIKPEAEVIG